MPNYIICNIKIIVNIYTITHANIHTDIICNKLLNTHDTYISGCRPTYLLWYCYYCILIHVVN